MGTRKGTYYDILGVTPAAPKEIISAVYRAWMKAMKVHPDLGGDTELAKTINEAYDVLKDAERRVAYDSKLADEIRGLYECERRAPRRKVDATIAFCFSPQSNWEEARVLDASALGLRIRSDKPVEAGNHLAIAFPGCCAMAAEATVKWVNHIKNCPGFCYEAGIEFFSPIPDILMRLK